jgi:hypothetical protein
LWYLVCITGLTAAHTFCLTNGIGWAGYDWIIFAHEYLWSQKPNPYWAEPGATANEHACHGLCSEQHTPRQARSSLSLNVRQIYRNSILLVSVLRIVFA